MISNVEKKIIQTVYENIITKYEFPNFGSPEIKCSKCMFYGVACFPASDCVGCYHGWKREKEK